MYAEQNLIFKDFSLQRSQIEHEIRYKRAMDYCISKDVLDVGCAARSGTKLLSKVANSVVGIDIIPEQVEYANNNFSAHNLRYEVQDTCDLKFDQNSFDTIVCLEVIEHVKDYQSAIRNFFKILRIGGLLIITTPNKFRNGRKYQQTSNEYHEYEFCADELSLLMTSNGFKILEFSGFKWQESVDGKSSAVFSTLRNLDCFSLRRVLPYKLKEKLGRKIKHVCGALPDSELSPEYFTQVSDPNKSDYFWIVVTK